MESPEILTSDMLLQQTIYFLSLKSGLNMALPGALFSAAPLPERNGAKCLCRDTGRLRKKLLRFPTWMEAFAGPPDSITQQIL